MAVYPAHIRFNGGEEQIQSVAQHCGSVADYAAETLRGAGLSASGELTGLIHDVGKMTHAFSEYITRAFRNEPVRRGSVNHTFAGVRLLFERYRGGGGASPRSMACEMLAFAVGAHHGLFDSVDPDGKDGFAHRLTSEPELYGEALSNLGEIADSARLDKLFEEAAEEIARLVALCRGLSKNSGEAMFYLAMLCRLLLSALIDADRRDTAEFMLNMRTETEAVDMRPTWAGRLSAVEAKLEALGRERPIDRARRAVSQACRAFPTDSEGVYRLSVPTGGGKTLTALRFALAEAQRHGKRRIIFVTPLLSVLEQNAKVIRDFLGEDRLILEHHSNVVKMDKEEDRLDPNELLTETWRAPVLITTLVQFLNTLFDGGTASIRRMAALTGSVVMIDEIQSLPRSMITPFNLAINFLIKVCHASVVLCSATQPCLEHVKHSLYREPPELAPRDPALWAVFRRTELIDRRKPGGHTPEELADFVRSILPDAGSVLFVCNKREQAQTLFRLLKGAEAKLFHLSNAMCMAHRIATLAAITASLGKEPVVCVATQLVEAGVDLDFGCVIRVSAGLDNAVQAAGRCNRHGDSETLRPVYIVKYNGEDLSHLKEIRRAQRAAEELLDSYKLDSRRFEEDLQSEAAIGFYYRRLFANVDGGEQDYPVSKYKTTLYKLLSANGEFRVKSTVPDSRVLVQAFKTAGKEFKVFDDDTTDVLVPYGEGKNLITELCSDRAEHDLGYRGHVLDRAKLYSVSLYAYQLRSLGESGGCCAILEGSVWVLQEGFYQDDTGFDPAGGKMPYLGGV